jgi:branched-chain amino acid transport system permease protein
MTINWRNFRCLPAWPGSCCLSGIFQSWTLSLTIVNLCLISAIMALGVNIQWGYAGLLNVGVMGFAALGGVGCRSGLRAGCSGDGLPAALASSPQCVLPL